MKEKINQQSIERLYISDRAIKIMNENNINTIGQLCKKSKSDLKKIEVLPNEINKIDIELQLLGLSLRGSL